MTQFHVTFHFRVDEPYEPEDLFFKDDGVYGDEGENRTGEVWRLYEGGPWTGVPMAMYQEVMGVLVGAGLVGPVITSHEVEETYEPLEGELDPETGQVGDEDGEDAHSGGGGELVPPDEVGGGGGEVLDAGVEGVHPGVGS